MGCFALLSMTRKERARCCHAERSEAESKHLVSWVLAYLGFALCKALPVLSHPLGAGRKHLKALTLCVREAPRLLEPYRRVSKPQEAA